MSIKRRLGLWVLQREGRKLLTEKLQGKKALTVLLGSASLVVAAMLGLEVPDQINPAQSEEAATLIALVVAACFKLAWSRYTQNQVAAIKANERGES